MSPSLADFTILPQPDETTCGPTCLQAVFRYFGDELALGQVIRDTPSLDDGGTLGVLLGTLALQRGYQVKIFTYNLRVFDPSWFTLDRRKSDVRRNEFQAPGERFPHVDLIDKLKQQVRLKDGQKLHFACQAYSNFIKLGGELRMHDLNKALIRHYLTLDIPILTGLSSTYLYQSARERQRDMKPDDLRGTPTGHFVVLCGEKPPPKKTVRVADPYVPNPFAEDRYYDVSFDRLICAILLGVLTYDANLLIIQPSI